MRHRGFTLIEITIAVLILAGSLVILLGLQSSATARSVDDRVRQHAMLEARKILTALELAPEEPALGEIRGPVRDVVSQIFQPLALESIEDSTQRESWALPYTFEATVRVDRWELPRIEDAMRRITVRVAWGPNITEAYEVEYFIPHVVEEQDPDPGTTP